MAPKLMKAADLAKQAGLMPAPAEPMALVPSGDPSLKAPASSTGSASLTAATPSPVDDQPFLFFG